MEISLTWAVWEGGFHCSISSKIRNKHLMKQRLSLYNRNIGTTKCGTRTRVKRTMVKLDDESASSRLHVTPDEVLRLRKEVRKGRNGHRNEVMIYMGYRHGFRCGELVRLKWNQILWEEEDIQVMRLKMRGKHPESDIHPLDHWEMKSLRALAKAAKTDKGWIFLSERKDGTRGGRMTERGFFQIIARAGIKAGLSVPVHPHMLRHGCGFRMNDEGRNSRSIQAWLGHRDISSTQIYCAMSSDYFRREGF